MSSVPDRVVVMTARNPFEAQVVVALLRGAEIPASVDDSLRMDEFAGAQRLLNQVGVQVFVPKERAAEASEVIAAARADNAIPDELVMASVEHAEPEVTLVEPRRGAPWLTLGLAGLAALLAFLWFEERTQVHALTRDTLWTSEWTEGNTVARHLSKRSGKPMWEQLDRDRNGINEEQRTFDRNGRLALVGEDKDQDGFFESWIEHFVDGSRAVYTDLDGDGICERREGFDAQGKALHVDEQRSGEGFVRIR